MERGCTLDVHSENVNWCKAENGCKTCSRDGCNFENVKYSTCLRCDSGTNSTCISLDEPSTFETQCSHKKYTFSLRGCYVSNKGKFNNMRTDFEK